MADTQRTDIVIVSDLHMDGGSTHRSGAFAERPFAALIGRLRADGRTRTIVLLGDTFDLPPSLCRSEAGAATGGGPQAELDRIAARWPNAFGALRAWIRDGGQLDIVAGNHDIALIQAGVQLRLLSLLGAQGDGSTIRFHSWFLHVAGVLHAEHGHQLHDLNSYAELPNPCCGAHAPDLPIGALVEVHRSYVPQTPYGARGAAARARARIRLAAAILRTIARVAWRGTEDPRATYRAARFPAAAAAEGVPAQLLYDLDELSQTGLLAMMRRLVAKAWRIAALKLARFGLLRGVGRTVARDDYLLARWPTYARILTAHAPVSVVAFGHTHVPREIRMAGGPVLMNPGSWLNTSTGRNGGAFVHIRVEPGRDSMATLRWWDGAAETDAIKQPPDA